MVDILTQKNALEQLTKLKADKFIGELQFRCLKDLLKSDERTFFVERVDCLYSIVEVMPKIFLILKSRLAAALFIKDL